jgi:two-component system, LytTR family, sensor kinase
MYAPDRRLRVPARLPPIAVTLLLIVIVATLFFTAVAYVSTLLGPGPSPARYMLIWHATKFGLWAAVSPGVIALSRRFPIERKKWVGPVTFHLFTALLCSFIVTSIFFTLCWEWPSLHRELFSSWVEALQTASIPFSWGVLIYWAILLATSALDNYNRYRVEELRGLQLQAQLAEAQLRTLRMQLQPHFLFNTLHSLSDLVLEDAESAVRMITKLGDFLRLTMEGPSEQLIPLRQELEFARSYLEIQQIRFHDRLEVAIAAEPQTYAAQVPNFFLQPLVENAVRHGISARIGAGRISINAKRSLNQLQITVEDDGPGPELLDEGPNEGVGLANTRMRLRQLYGEEQSLQLTRLNPEKGGTIVSLNIPFIASRSTELGNGEI